MEKMVKPYMGIEVSNFCGQPVNKRYPEFDPLFHTPEVFDVQLFHQDPYHDPFDPTSPPSIAPWRSNLVALSQKENLYFVAYNSSIHVTVPRGLIQLIPGAPDLVIDLPVSQEARRTGGYIDADSPHAVNSMLVGSLGSQEILLMACDDGDIIAFFVSTIVTCLESGNATKTVKPFFHENVGSSAWGLAIHTKSRLIAASCNKRHITVFMPAFTSDEEIDAAALPSTVYVDVPEIPRPSSRRQFNIKKEFKLGVEGHNLPAVDFADDSNGDACSILGCDITGNLWIFGFYDRTIQRIPNIDEGPFNDDRNIVLDEMELMYDCRSWGVVVLPLSAFKRAEIHDALGNVRHLQSTLSVGLVGPKIVKIFDITGCASPTDPNPVSSSQLPNPLGFNMSPLLLESDSEEDEEDEDDDNDSGGEHWSVDEMQMAQKLNTILTRATSSDPVDDLPFANGHYLDPLEHRSLSHMDRLERFAADRAKLASRRRHGWCAVDVENMINMLPKDLQPISTKHELHDFLEKQYQSNKKLSDVNKGRPNSDATLMLPAGSAILRTYQHDVELLPPTPACPRTLCRRIVRHAHIHPGIIGHRGYARLNMVVPIPELSLVVVGSQAGRAALVSLTRIDDRASLNGPVVSFRIDGFLPSRDSHQERVWPRRPILGMAAAPVQTAEGLGVQRFKRWRLFMHFYDHTILTWELSRDVGTDALVAL